MSNQKSTSSKSKSRRRNEPVSPEMKAKAEAEVENVSDVQVLKEKRDEYNERTKNLVKERRRLEEEMRSNRDRASDYKARRDELNAEVQKIKKEKNERYDKISKLNEDLKAIRQKENAEEEPKDKPRKKKGENLRGIKRQIKHLEQRIITDDIDIKEENEIIAEIQKLEIKKAEFEGKSGKTKESRNVIKNITALRKEIDEFSKRIQEISQESQNCHVLMLELYKENDSLRKELDQTRDSLVESKVIADEYHNKFRELGAKARNRKVIRGSNGRLQKQLKKQVAEDTLKDALVKKKKGQKLNIFEARALFENAVSDSDEK